MEGLEAYTWTLGAMAAMGGMMLVQILIVDFAGIRARHLPGAPVPVDHKNILFRATRAHANTNESIAVFILLAAVGVLAGARAEWLAWLTWTYVGARLLHMLFYYADLRWQRSTAFGVGLVALLGMFGVTAAALLRNV